MGKCWSSTDKIDYVLAIAARQLKRSSLLYFRVSYSSRRVLCACTMRWQKCDTRGFTPAMCPPVICRPQPHRRAQHTAVHGNRRGKVNRGAHLERTPASFACGLASDFAGLCSTHT